jgi:galactokinase
VSGPHAERPLPKAAQTAVERWRARFGGDAAEPDLVACAPGRINLIGEHTDYNDGLVLPMAVDRAVALAGCPVPGTRARLWSAYGEPEAELDLVGDALCAPAPPATLPRWARYIWGALAELQVISGRPDMPAFEAAIAGDVPIGGGMSSSSALTVAATAFAAAVAGIALTPIELARLAQRGEQRGSGVRGGIMDQMTACLGRAGHALLLDCRSLAYDYIALNLPDVLLVTYDTCVPHELAASEYNVRRLECEQAVALLAPVLEAETPGRRVTALRDVALEDLARYGGLLPQVLLQRARHVVRENGRVEYAALELQAGRAGRTSGLGVLLYASHASLRDDYAVSCPELDAVVEIAANVPGVVGARMMGAGFGGSVLILVQREAWPRLEQALAQEYPERTGRTGLAYVCASADGAAVARASN